MNAETIIFDLDGTISNPFDGITRSVNYALESEGYDTRDPQEIGRLIGPPLKEIFETLLGDLSEVRLQALVAAYRERYAASGYRENQLYEDVPSVIAALHNDGYALGVCTSKRADYAGKIVDMFGLSPYFRFVDGGDVHVAKRQQLERIVQNGVQAESAVMIGDRAVDIEAAKANRISSVGVCWGFGDLPELSGAAPDHIVESPRELLELFA